MDIEYIKPTAMSNFCPILFSPPNLSMLFIDRHISMLSIAAHTHTYIHIYNCNRLNTQGAAESYMNELQLRKLHISTS